MDSYAGLATDPLSMNRFLYAEANPTTFIDPTGHFVFLALLIPIAVGFFAGAGIDAGVQQVTTGHVDWGQAAVSGAIGAVSGGTGAVVGTAARTLATGVARPLLARAAGYAANTVASSVSDLAASQALGQGDDWGADDVATASATGVAADVALEAVARAVPRVGRAVDALFGALRKAEGTPTPRWVPSPNGRTGGAAHQQTVADVRSLIESQGLEARTEVHVPTPGGAKPNRFADVGAYDRGELVELHQVGRETRGGIPVSRERSALADITTAKPSVPVFWHRYGPE
jgi:hypothetical protein